MNININCIDNDKGYWCKNPNVKKSLFGLGARCCTQVRAKSGETCPYQTKYERPKAPLMPPCKPARAECSECGR